MFLRTVLVIGGTTFMGYQLVWQLIGEGWAVTLVNRGRHRDPYGDRVERLVVDRRSPEFQERLRGGRFDAAIDFAGYSGRDAEGAVKALLGRVGHYVYISSGSAYLVREGIQLPVAKALAEEDYAGNMMEAPNDADDLANWRYGAGKREAESVFERARHDQGFPVTRIRLPIVHGIRDPERRLETYFWRIRDGGPLFLPDGGKTLTRHVYVTDVVKALVELLRLDAPLGEAYNLSQDEDIPLYDLVERMAHLMGIPARIVPVSAEELTAVGLEPRMVSPLSGRWASRLDPSRAKRELDFRHRPLERYLESLVEGFWGHEEPPSSYFRRKDEITLLGRRGHR